MTSPQVISRLSVVKDYIASYAPKTTLPGITLATAMLVANRALAHIPKVSEWAVSKLGSSVVRKLSGFSVAGFCIGVVSLLALNMLSYRRLVCRLEPTLREQLLAGIREGNIRHLNMLGRCFSKRTIEQAMGNIPADDMRTSEANGRLGAVLNWMLRNLGEEFLEQTNDNGDTFAHWAAISGETKVLCGLEKKLGEEFLKQTDKSGHTIAHKAAFRGKEEAFLWMHETLGLDFIKQKSVHNVTVANCAAEAGSLELLRWIQDKLGLGFLLLADQLTIAHSAAYGGKTEVLDWIKEVCGEEFLKKVSIRGSTIAHIAALNGQMKVLDWIKQIFGKKFLKQVDIYGNTIAHVAARNGQIEVLDWIKNNFSEKRLKQAKKNGDTIAHVAAKAGEKKVLEWIKNNLGEDFLEQVNNLEKTAHQILVEKKQNPS
jgi:ankyrin repeat protein